MDASEFIENIGDMFLGLVVATIPWTNDDMNIVRVVFKGYTYYI